MQNGVKYDKSIIMQPSEDSGVGGPYRDPRPDCTNGGPHRYGAIHLANDHNQFVQTCRRCGNLRRDQIVINNGVITSTPPIHSDKSTNENDVKI